MPEATTLLTLLTGAGIIYAASRSEDIATWFCQREPYQVVRAELRRRKRRALPPKYKFHGSIAPDEHYPHTKMPEAMIAADGTVIAEMTTEFHAASTPRMRPRQRAEWREDQTDPRNRDEVAVYMLIDPWIREAWGNDFGGAMSVPDLINVAWGHYKVRVGGWHRSVLEHATVWSAGTALLIALWNSPVAKALSRWAGWFLNPLGI